MPAKSRSKKPPAAPQRKRLLHAFYMAQPFLQFFALMVVLFALGRCSPLSPSSDKSKLKGVSENGVVATPGEDAQNRALEEDIKKNLREVSSVDELNVLTRSAFDTHTRESLHADKTSDPGRVRFIFQQRARELRKITRVMVLPLSPTERQKLLQGQLRVDLVKRLATTMNPETQRLYFSLLRDHRHITGRPFLILADDAQDVPSSIAVPTKVQMAFLGDDRAFLQVVRTEPQLDDSQQELVRSNLERAIGLAVVLE